jgi:uncharacterized protein
MTMKRPNRMLGPGHNTFWDWCAKGELRLQRCARCGHFCWPVTAACEKCAHDALVWTPMSGKGSLVSWCRFERDYYSGLLPIPWDTILVELAEGPLFISNPMGFSWLECEAALPLCLHFIDCEDSAGKFRLPVFARA